MSDTKNPPAKTPEKAEKKPKNEACQAQKELYMPPDFSLSLKNKGGTDFLLSDNQAGPRQKMAGFEEKYTDIIDYIVRITHNIWEDKNIGYIYDTYSHASNVYDDFGLQYGRDKIVADTVHTINAFPDIRLFADEIIWAGDDQTGFYTSHRTVITGTNTGYSRYGAPTNRKIRLLCIANCVALKNEIFLEHVIYDHCALIVQLGFDVWEIARKIKEATTQTGLGDKRCGENERLPGQGKPIGFPAPQEQNFKVRDFVEYLYHNTWNRRNLNVVNKFYAPNIRWHGSCGREFFGVGAAQSYILSHLATFPDAHMQVEEVYWMGNPEEGYLVSVRWSVSGIHAGFGLYGEPTGKTVRYWGIDQLSIYGGKVREVWSLFNELGLLIQMA